jgi:hypothetical protein
VPRNEKAPAFQAYAADELADAATMTREEFGIWNVLRAEAWRGCGLPTDPARLAVLMGVPRADVDRVWAVVGAQFVERDGRYVLPFLEAQREKHQALRERNAQNGQHGGRPRKPAPPPPEPPEETQKKPSGLSETNPDESSSSCSLRVSNSLPASLPARVESAASQQVRPATEQDVAAITGVLIGDIAGAALLWTIAMNRGVTEAHGEQPVPIRHDGQLEAAETLLGAGVDVAWGANWLYHRAKRSTRRSIPRSLAYLARGLREAWADHLADRTQREHAAAFVPGEPTESRAVVPAGDASRFAPRPTRTDRVVERSLQGSLSAIARYKGRTA